MSAPQFAEFRPLSGNLVAEKAQLYGTRRHREMLFFLHGVSLQPGGLKTLARRMIAEFPENFVSVTMQQLGDKLSDALKGKDGAEVEERVEQELYRGTREGAREISGFRLANFLTAHAPDAESRHGSDPLYRAIVGGGARGLLAQCHFMAGKNLPRFLAELCLDPELDLEELEQSGRCERAPYVTRVWEMLKHYKHEADSGASGPRVVTTIGEKINATLEHALVTRRMVVVEGTAGSGKSHSAEDWCRMHSGQARYISLSGITHRTGLFQKIAACIGLAAGGRKAAELQARIEDFFAKSKLMLVVDEAHYLWPQTRRCSGPPEFVNWINTALVNQGVPVAFICTDQFVRLKGNVEKQTGWTSEQLMHRIKRYTKLPARPTEADLRSVADLLLAMEWNPEEEAWKAGRNKVGGPALKLAVGYALLSRLPMAAVRDLVDEARAQARAAFRSVVTFEDMELAWREYQVPSDVAMKSAFPTSTDRPAKMRKSRAYVVGTTEPGDTDAREAGSHLERSVTPAAGAARRFPVETH